MDQISNLDRIRKNGVMRIPVAFTKEPKYGVSEEFYIDSATGKPAGVVIEYMDLMCADLGVKAEYMDMPWGEHIDALLTDKVDILPKHSNLPSRALVVDFAQRVINFDVLVIIRKDSDETMETLNMPGKKVAVSKGSSNLDLIKKYFPQAEVTEIEEYTMGADLLEAGEVDFWVESPVVKKLFEVRPKIKPLRKEDGSLVILAREYAHPGVKAGDSRFLNWINNWMMYRLATGELQEIIDRWKATLME